MLGTIGYMSPEQVRGQAGGRAERHLRLRRDPLRDAVGQARLPRRLGGGHDVGDPERGPAGPLASRTRTSRPGSSGSSGTASRRTRSSGSSRRATSRSTSRRCRESPLREARRQRDSLRSGPGGSFPSRSPALVVAGRARRRLLPRQAAGFRPAAVLHPADVPPRAHPIGALRAGRADDPLFRGVGRQADRDLREPLREPGIPPLRRRRRGPARNLVDGRAGSLDQQPARWGRSPRPAPWRG